MKNINRNSFQILLFCQIRKFPKGSLLILFLSGIFNFLISELSAQMECGTDHIHQHKMANDPEYKKNIEKTESEIFNIIQNREKSGLRSDEMYTIPIVVHVIHLGEPVGTGTNISDQQIYDAIKGLNERWKNVIGEGVDMGFEFCLAKRDPNNQTTTGIIRVNGSGINRYSSSGITWDGSCGASETAIKDLSKWPTSEYYNIWVVNKICGTLSGGSGIAGYADYPNGGTYDGTVIGQLSMNYNSVTLAHEVGHGFHLMHTFEGPNSNCPPNNNCLQDGDRVCDTPPHRQSDCGTTNPCTSSGIWDNSRRNYMSYCGNRTRFTNGQKERSKAAAIASIRKPLLTSIGCLPLLNNDVSIVKINEPTIKTIYIDNCPGKDSINLNVRVQNVGIDTISTIKFKIFINGNLVSPIIWYGNVANNELINVDLLKIKIDTGLFNITIVADSVNNKLDDYNLINSVDFIFNCKRISSVKIENETTNSTCAGLNNGAINLNVSKHLSIKEDFETHHDWILNNNDSYNFWIVGNQISNGGNKSIYITDDSLNYKYNPTKVSAPNFYKDFYFPNNCSNVELKFDLKVKGLFSGSNFGGILIYAVPSHIDIINSNITEYLIEYLYNLDNFSNKSYDITNKIIKGNNTKIVFRWNNYGTTGIQPPAAIDNIEISYDLPATGPYSFEWAGPITSSEQNLINVQSGNYNVKVIDTLGCNNEKNIIINAPPILNVASEVINNLCYGVAEGSINVTPLNGMFPYKYNWSNGRMNDTIINLISDSYYLTISDRSNIIDQLPTSASCTPNSTTPGFNIGIYNVNLNSINHNSLSAQIESYRNFTNIKTYLHDENESFLTVQTGPDYNERVLAWIDFNNNGIFEDTEQIMNSVNSLPIRFHRNKFSIPQTAIKNIPLRLRVGSDISSGLNTFTGPCNNSRFGQIEDYTIIIGYPACSIYSFDVLEPSPIEATLNLINSQIFCEGDSIELSVTEAYSYLWSTSDTTQTISIKESGDYFVMVTDSNGCTAISDTITVLVHPLPTPIVNASGATTFCSGNSVTLSSSITGVSYLWSNNETTQNISATMTGNYSVEVTDSNGCKGTSTAVIVTENPLPTPIVNESGATTFCSGGSVMLSSSVTGASYLWSNNETTQSISATTTGNYSVEVTDANGCTGTSTITSVTVNPLPTPILNTSGATTFCSGNSVTLSSSITGVSYLWSNNETTKSISATTTGNYSVAVTDANGCTGTSTAVNITVNPLPLPIVNASGVTTFCSGNSVTLSSSFTGVSYLWSNNATTQSISATTTGNYSVEVTDANGCTGTSTITSVTVNPLPTPILNTNGATTFCLGNSVTLSSSITGVSYLWSNNETTQSIIVSTSENYTLIVTDSNGCTAISDTITVLVHTLPDATLLTDGNLSFCFGDSISISCTESSTYLWNSGETSKEIVVKNSGHYLVTVTDSFGCSAISDSIGVVVHNLPEITLTPGGVTTFCKGDSVTLFSSQAVSYLWSSGATTQNITVYNSGNYFINIIDNNNCQAESPPINVVVNELPVPIISSNEPTNFCQGDSITLMSSHAVSYLWNTLDTIRSIIVSKSGDYFVIVTDDNGCKGKSIPLTVVETDNPIANISLSRSPIMCLGDSIILSADNAESYLWSNGSTTQSVIINTEGQYSVTVINSMGCISVSPSITVVINPLPISAIEIIGESSFCQGESVNLKATFAISYAWSNNATTQNINVSTSGTYIVSTTDINGCSAASSPILVTVHSLPTPNISSNGETTFCLGGTVTLTSSSAASYLWLNGSTSQSIDVITTGDYLLTVTDVNGCTGVTSQNVLVNELPRVVIDFIGETSFCKDNQLVISANDAETYLWSTGEITKSVEITETGTYTVSITDANGCVGVSTGINTIVFPLPSSAVTVIGELEFCRNDSLILTADPAKDYLWSTGDSSQTIIVKSSGEYRVTITDSNGCSAISSNHIVKVNDLPFTEIVANGLTNICFGETLILTSSKAVSYLWSNSDENQSIEVTASGTYVVTITDDNGCKGVSSPLTITLLPLPSSTITLSGLPVFCDGDSVTIKASSVDSYLWSTGETNQSINTSTSGDYVVTVTDINGCTAVSTSISITVHPLPLAQIVPDGPTTFCQGKSVTLTADSTLNYKWSTDETSQSIKVSSAGDYVVTVTNENGCSAISLPTTIIVNPLPEAMIVPDGPTTFCLGENVILTASEAQSYAWNSGQTTLSVDITSPGVNVVTVTDANGCSAVSSEILVIVNPLLTPEVIISTPAISVLSCQDVTFTPTPINGGISPTYQWFVNGNPVSISPSFSTSTLINGDWISCLMTSSATCKSTPTATSNTLIMSVSQLPQPTIIISEDTISSVNYKDAQYLYSWYFNGNEVSKSPYLICNQFGSGSYYLVINYNGCTDTSNTTDIVCTVPTNDIGNSIYFMVYPNPTNNVINISGINISSGEFRIEAYNVLGQKLEEKRILSLNDSLDSYLDMSGYASGIYTIVVYCETYRQVFKVYKIE